MGEQLCSTRTVGAVLEHAAQNWGSRSALVMHSREFSYADVYREALLWLGMLQRCGAQPGDRVLILLRNSPEYVFVWLAMSLGGFIEVPVNAAYKGRILEHVLQDSGAALLVTSQEFLPTLEPVRPESLTTVLVADADSTVGDASAGAVAATLDGAGVPVQPAPRESDLVAVMYTSGTTGPSKGALITHRHAYEYAAAVRVICELDGEDTYFSSLPLFHVAGQWAVVYACLQSGAKAHITDGFSASSFWSECITAGGTVSFLLGAMAQFLMAQPVLEADSENPLERVLIAPLIDRTAEFRKRFEVRVTTCYGSTESGVPIVGDFDVEEPSSVGRAREGYQLRIVDEWDEEVPPGVTGELIVRPSEPWRTFVEYQGLPVATREAQRNLWLHTGDAMKMDRDGNLYFVDRVKDTIRRRGENISSFEVEREIKAYPGVVDCAAVGVKSAHTEEDLVVFVVPENMDDFDRADLVEFLRKNAPRFMLPDEVKLVESLPMTPTGKVQKSRLREWASGVNGDAGAEA